MKPLALAMRALPFTFALYVLEAVLASFVALPTGLELGRQLRASSWDAAQSALFLERLPELAALLRTSSLSGLIALAALWLLGPWLQMSWFAALAELSSPLAALARGARLVPRAWLVSLLVGLTMLLAAAPFLLIAYALHGGLSSSPDARFHDLMLSFALLPLLPLAVFGHVLHDLARARAFYSGALDGLVNGLRSTLSWAVLLRAVGLSALGFFALLAAHAIAWQVDGAFRFLIAVVALQSALLGRLFVRSVWLAIALACVLPAAGPLAERGNEDNDESY